MSVDLQKSLAQLAQSVQDDGATDRMSRQVHHMVGRVRRRRLARQTATGVVGAGTVTAVAFAGVQLTDRESRTAPAMTGATGWQCGATVDAAAGDATEGMTVSVGTVDRDGPVTSVPVAVSFRTDSFGADTVTALAGHPALVVTRDGVVVSEPARLDAVAESMPPIYTFEQPLTSCESGSEGALLVPGDYEVVAVQTVTLAEVGPVEVFGEAPLRVGEANAVETPAPVAPPALEAVEPELTDEQRRAQGLVDELVANPAGTFPACGSTVSAAEDGVPPLALDLTLPGTVLAGGETFTGTVDLRTTEGRHVLGNANPAASLLVLRDGVVVAHQPLAVQDLTFVDLAPGTAQPFELRGSMTVCGPDEGATGAPLPPGSYQAMAVLDVMLKEIQPAEGEAESSSLLLHAVSDPADITVR